MTKTMINRIHFFYITGILVAIIICLLTFRFGNDPKLLDYISFALTMTSLFLALLAIIYSYYSNSTFTQNITFLNKASSQVSESSQKIIEVTKSLDEKVESLPLIMKNIEDKVDLTHYYLQNFTEKKQLIEPAENKEIPTDILDNYFNWSSTMGLYALYAASLSYKNKKPFTLEELEKASSLLLENYTFGFLVATSSFGIYTKTDHSKELNIIHFNKYILDNIERHVNKRAKVDKKTGGSDYLFEQIARIESFIEKK